MDTNEFGREIDAFMLNETGNLINLPVLLKFETLINTQKTEVL